jgi:hypothetical protein
VIDADLLAATAVISVGEPGTLADGICELVCRV